MEGTSPPQQPEQIQKRLEQTGCPVCKQSSLIFIPRGESGTTATTYKVRCNNCSYLFPLNVPVGPIERVDPDLGHWLKALLCPECHQRGAQYDFRCTPTVRLSLYFVTCKSCGHPYQESAPMEAYE